MKIARELEQLCKTCIDHFDELDAEGVGKIKVFSIELDSHTIWGGNGDCDTARTYYISKEGWLVRDTVSESGLYQRGDGIVNDTCKESSPEDIEKDINGTKVTLSDLKELLKFYDMVREKYLREIILF